MAPPPTSADRPPVIVGIGEISDRPTDPTTGLEPLALIATALRRAERDAGMPLLAALDSLDIVNVASWRYRDPLAQLRARTGIAPQRAVYGPVGGETPVRFIHEAALRIARGESEVAAICGGEAQSSVTRAERAGLALPWTTLADDAPVAPRSGGDQHPMAAALGLTEPVAVYPLYDNATAAHWGQTPREALAESGALWARHAEVAARNPHGWIRRACDAETIVTPTLDNRLIAWPYTKLMVANPSVNQAAALVLTTLARARAAGVAEARMVHVWGGAAADDPRDVLARDRFVESHAQNAVLDAALALAGGEATAFDAIELYSCFPCVPKMARRRLGLDAGATPTVTGGLTFFGAPLSAYMAHAACAMVRHLRDGGRLGLLYGQGGYMTQHHALVLAARPPDAPLAQDVSVQQAADARRGAAPRIVPEAAGEGRVETFTVLYDRTGVRHGVVVLRTADDARTLAKVAPDDAATLARLTDLERSAIGASGPIGRDDEGLLRWRIGA